MAIVGYEIDFLPVGNGERSGDAIALRCRDDTLGDQIMVIDGGTQESGQALVNHIRKYYRSSTVHHVVNTHPDADHASGLTVVLGEMEVKTLWMHLPWGHSNEILGFFRDGRITTKSLSNRLIEALTAAHELYDLAIAKKIPIREPFAGETIGPFVVLSPDREWYKTLLADFRSTPAAKTEYGIRSGVGLIGKLRTVSETIMSVFEKWDIETLSEDGQTSAENESSVVLFGNLAQEGVLLTGDAGLQALERAAIFSEWMNWDLAGKGFVQTPHHGSRNNVSPSILDRVVGPRVSKSAGPHKTTFVSASAKSETHPRRVVTNAFKRRGCRVHVTRGTTWHHRQNMPSRDGWVTRDGEPFHQYVEE